MMKNLTKIKLDSDDKLPLNKRIEIPVMVIDVRAIFYENNKYHSQVFLDKCLNKIQKCYIMIELTFQKEMMVIKQVCQKTVLFVTTGIS